MQAGLMARTHKPPTLGYEDDVENKRERNERNKREKEKEKENREEKKGKNERGDKRRQEEEEESHRCVHGVPETAYGNGGVC